MKKQMLMTKQLAQQLPPLDKAYDSSDPHAYIHYFHIMTDFHWYILAGEQVITNDNHQWRDVKEGEEPNDWILLAKVYSPMLQRHGSGWEIGTLYLSDIVGWEKHSVIPVERDHLFSKRQMSECDPYSRNQEHRTMKGGY